MRGLRFVVAVALVAVAMGGAVSCNDSTAPAPVLPPFAAAEVAALESLDASALFSAIIGANSVSPLFGTTTGGSATPLFADSILGSTLTYDCALGRFIRDTTLTGAPPAGVRIELYYQGDTFEPYCPLFPLAHLDLTDVSDTAPALEAVVRDVIPGIEHMHFMVRAPQVGGAAPFAVNGVVSDGVRHFAIAGSLDHTVTVNHHDSVTFTRAETGAVLRVIVDQHDSLVAGGHAGLAQDVDLRASRDRAEVRMHGAYFLCDTCGFFDRSLVVAVDGRPFGTIVSHVDSVTFIGPDGRSMTSSEEEAMSWLQAVFFSADAAVNYTTGLLARLLPLNHH